MSLCLAKVCGKRQVGKGAHSMYSGYSCSRQVYMSVLFIIVEVRVSTRSSLYTGSRLILHVTMDTFLQVLKLTTRGNYCPKWIKLAVVLKMKLWMLRVLRFAHIPVFKWIWQICQTCQMLLKVFFVHQVPKPKLKMFLMYI